MRIGINPKKFMSSLLSITGILILVFGFLGLFRLFNMSQPKEMDLKIITKSYSRGSSGDYRSFRLMDKESGLHYSLSPTESWYNSVNEGDSFTRDMKPINAEENTPLMILLFIDACLWGFGCLFLIWRFIDWCFETDKELTFEIRLPSKPFSITWGYLEDKRNRSVK